MRDQTHQCFATMSSSYPVIAGALMLQVVISFSTAMGEVTELPFLDLGDETRVPGEGKFFGTYEAAVMLEAELPSFPFGDGNETRIFISPFGTISFGVSFVDPIPEYLPIPEKIVAPYWDDIDVTENGLILYAALIKGQESHLSNSQYIFDIVNGYITDTVLKNTSIFRAQWILAVRWIDVCSFVDHHCDLTEPNTFQAVLATDSTRSYAVFTYECGKLNWIDFAAAIGFSASDDFFAEHPLSHGSNVNNIACINKDSIPPSNWSNLAYKISKTVVCNPSCQNGACVDNNICHCSEGYTGQTCDTVVSTVSTECTQNPCQNQGTCQLLKGSYSCVCMSGYTGNFCENDIPITSAHVPIASVTAAAKPTNNPVSTIIGATIGSVATVLLLCVILIITTIVIIIAAVIWYSRRNKSDSPDQFAEEDDGNCNAYEFKTY